MRLLIWNCKGGLHAKLSRIRQLQPDVAIIPECAAPQVLRKKSRDPLPGQLAWLCGPSNSINKGLGVFAFGDYRLTTLESPTFHTIVPLRIEGPATFHLLAVWSFHYGKWSRRSQTGPLLDAISYHRNLILQEPALVAGDFNNQVSFDTPNRRCNHATTVMALEALGLESAYHAYFTCSQGSEAHPTQYMHHDRLQPYHIDHCFLTRSWIPRVRTVEIGTFDEWSALSDHMPMLIDIDHSGTHNFQRVGQSVGT